MTTYYVLKVKGKAKIPDYIQVRDADFTLVGYFRPGRLTKTGRMKDPNQALFQSIELQADGIPFGTITEVQVDAAALTA